MSNLPLVGHLVILCNYTALVKHLLRERFWHFNEGKHKGSTEIRRAVRNVYATTCYKHSLLKSQNKEHIQLATKPFPKNLLPMTTVCILFNARQKPFELDFYAKLIACDNFYILIRHIENTLQNTENFSLH